jgi:hypothetical protein
MAYPVWRTTLLGSVAKTQPSTQEGPHSPPTGHPPGFMDLGPVGVTTTVKKAKLPNEHCNHAYPGDH